MEIVKSNAKHYLGKYSRKEYQFFDSCMLDILNSGAEIVLGDLRLNTCYANNKDFVVQNWEHITIREFTTFRGAWEFMEREL